MRSVLSDIDGFIQLNHDGEEDCRADLTAIETSKVKRCLIQLSYARSKSASARSKSASARSKSASARSKSGSARRFN